ncbi:MAG: metallophosphoesterase [Bryobacteraceae bacterium]
MPSTGLARHELMVRVRLLHIGDIHYPEARIEKLADVKDKGFPTHLIGYSNLRPLELVMRQLLTEIELGCDGILMSGDLTCAGNITGYEECLQYLSSTLESIAADRIHVVPGNHDVDRAAVDKSGRDIGAKFKSFQLAWERVGLPVLTVDGVRISDIASPTAGQVRILSMNSSIGCGEKRYLPPEIADELEAILKKFAASAPPKDAFALIGETLDTPAFQQKDIDDACSGIANGGAGIMPIVLSHHNLLPQALPRIALYAELLNAGIARSRLLGLRRTLLYCHGHIHDDPIEILADASAPGTHVICVSAPTLSRGFNSIAVEFGRKGFPLGCIITRYRFNTRDGSVENESIRIPLHTPNFDSIRRLGNDHVLQIIESLAEEEIRFKDLQNNLKRDRGRLQTATLAESLLEAEWLGCIALRNQEYEPEHWHVRRIGI